MKYLNFAVELAALPDGRYRITVSSPVGEAYADVTNPFTDAEIADVLSVLGREKDGVTDKQVQDSARAFGEKLFIFLFRASNEINNAYFTSLDRAGSDGLRLRLSVERAGLLSHLPWELLLDPDREFLALSNLTPVVRYTQQLTTRPPVPLTQPLRVLVAISSPSDFPALDVEGEWNRLQEATAELQKRGLITLERLDKADLLELQRLLRAKDYHVFHFIGHSDFDPSTNQGVLVFDDPNNPGKGQIVSGAALARQLGDESTIRLVILNSCRSARRVDQDRFSGIASSLVARGIPAVVAMQFEITDRAAKVFAEEFYRALADMMPIESAVSEARRAIDSTLQNTEWATPVLYMRSESGVLFQTTEMSSTRPNQSNRATIMVIAGVVLALILIGLVAVSGSLFNQDTSLAATTTAIVQLQTQSVLQTLTAIPTLTPTINPAARADLQISRVRAVPDSIAPGQFFRVNLTITNAGSSPSGHFAWTWDANVSSIGTQQNTVDGDVDNIQPGSSKTVSFAFLYGWWGTYSTQLRVDVDDEVNESNKRNNAFVFAIDVQNLLFDIDFSLLPDTSEVSPPMLVDNTTFTEWNMNFGFAATQGDPCAVSPLQIIDVNGDRVMTTERADAACVTDPMSVTFTRRWVSDAQIVLLPVQAGEATVSYFTNATDTAPFFITPPVTLMPGTLATIGGINLPNSVIRRIQINAPGQPVRLTRLILSPPPPEQ